PGRRAAPRPGAPARRAGRSRARWPRGRPPAPRRGRTRGRPPPPPRPRRQGLTRLPWRRPRSSWRRAYGTARSSRKELFSLDRDDFAPFVEAAVGADLVRRLDLAALRAERAAGGDHLVVRTPLAAPRLRMASLGKRHRVSCLSRPLGPVLEGRPARIERGRLARAGR